MEVVETYTEDGIQVETLESGELRLTNPDGHSVLWPAPSPGPRLIDSVDPRIDLTQPIYEQVLRLSELDRAEDARKEQASGAA